MKFGSTLVSVLLLVSSTGFAAEMKEFTCQVGFYIDGPGHDYGDENKTTFKGEIKQWHGRFATTSGAIKVDDEYTVVVDLHWMSHSLNNDDVTTKKDPQLEMTARLQKKFSDGMTRVVDFGHFVISRPTRTSLGRIFAETRLTPIEKLNELLELNPERGHCRIITSRGHWVRRREKGRSVFRSVAIRPCSSGRHSR